MSEDSAAVLRRGYEAFLRGDIEGVLNLLADDIEWEVPVVPGSGFGGIYRGKAAVAEFFGQLAAAEDILSFEPQDFIAQGERVAAIGRSRGRVRLTGTVVELAWIHVVTVQNGKMTRFFEMFDTAAAARGYQQAVSA